MKPSEPDFQGETFERFLSSITLKECLVYDNGEIYNRFIGYVNQVTLMKQKTIQQVTKEFLASELYGQRTSLLQLLLKSNEHEFQYLAYLLYDLLSSDSNGVIDTREQSLLFESLPWPAKQFFREAMKQTISYTNSLSSFDNSKIPLEQQICLLKADDSVKERAMQKLKEVKSKSDDSGSKARQYLEALLKIPFGVYRDEPVLKSMSEIVYAFGEVVKSLTASGLEDLSIPIKEKYTSIESRRYAKVIMNNGMDTIRRHAIESLVKAATLTNRRALIENVCHVNTLIKQYAVPCPRLRHSGMRIEQMQDGLKKFIESSAERPEAMLALSERCGVRKEFDIPQLVDKLLGEVAVKEEMVQSYMKNVQGELDSAVHGHTEAKRQVERIVGQWANGERTGYCLGFEGPPGVGKTSLAKKGLANCLKDEEGNPRPFAFVAIGGSANGSTLDGHSYTYVGSTWGRIVDILIEKKCMNPIIFIDELDKVSRTEHGREIIGILTHLVDPSQNDAFEDKYFSGVELDLSQALFIFSYNDVDAIDSVLLDRIHRVKFQHLSLDDKLVVCRKHILPEIFKKMGMEGDVDVPDEVLSFIVERYTAEPESANSRSCFTIIGEPMSSLRTRTCPDHPDYRDGIRGLFKKRHEVKPQAMGHGPRIGVVNGLWANAAGRGGVLPIGFDTSQQRLYGSNLPACRGT